MKVTKKQEIPVTFLDEGRRVKITTNIKCKTGGDYVITGFYIGVEYKVRNETFFSKIKRLLGFAPVDLESSVLELSPNRVR